jgi:hypothetical protein
MSELEGGGDRSDWNWHDHEIDIEEQVARKFPNSNGSPSPAPEGKRPPPPLAYEAAVADWKHPLPAPIPTGITALDRIIGGFRAESVYVLNGPPGRGKTGLAIQLVREAARTWPVLYLSSELSRRQALARFVAQLLGCSWLEVYNFEPSAVERIAGELCRAPKLRAVELRRGDNIAELCSRVADAEGKAPLLVLDYLQHAARRLDPEDMKRATSSISDSIAMYTRDSRGSALVVSSVARSFYSENENKSAIDFVGASKESGDVEFDAAASMFLDCEPCPPGGTSAARLHVSKHRFGSVGTVGLEFDGRVGVFKPDPAGALTEEQREIYEAIRSGAETIEELLEATKRRKQDVLQIVKLLAARHLITKNPYMVVPG